MMATKAACELALRLTIPTIKFFHPAYDAIPLLDICGYDGNYKGINLRTALTVCGIVACNPTGYFSVEQHGNATEGLDNFVLAGTEYYYHVMHWPAGADGQEEEYLCYPICPSFEDWRYPFAAVMSP